MSSKKSRTDLLVRVRYQNPLPPPPFPPKLINVSTSLDRVTSYEFLEPLCSEREMPMIVDGELGMPLEIGKIRPGDYGDGEYWLGDRSKIAVKPAQGAPVVPEEDAWMLGDAASISSTAPGLMPNSPASFAYSDRKKADVSWLRKTEYMAGEQSRPSTSALAQQANLQKASTPAQIQALSREGRIKAIQASFSAANAPLDTLKHPTKSHLTAETSWSLIPDAYLWAHNFTLTRFGEDPGEGRNANDAAADPRLPRAIFRPLQVPGAEPRVGYYLLPEDESAVAYEQKRRATDDEIAADRETTYDFRWVRDYEIASSRELLNEYIFCFDDGSPSSSTTPTAGDKPGSRRRGVYYSKLTQMDNLRKRRLRRGEKPDVFPRQAQDEGVEFWHGINVAVKPASEDPDDLKEERKELEDEVKRIPPHEVPSVVV